MSVKGCQSLPRLPVNNALQVTRRLLHIGLYDLAYYALDERDILFSDLDKIEARNQRLGSPA